MDFFQKLHVVPLSNEFQKLLQSLPKESAWGLQLYQYQGAWYLAPYLEAVLFSQKHFQARDTDIFIVTPPKSGTTWLKSLAFAITNRAQHAPSDPSHPLLKSISHELVPSFEVCYLHNTDPNISHMPSPRIFATHGPYSLLPDSIKNSKCRILFLCRNPKDTFISTWHDICMLQNDNKQQIISFEEAFKWFCTGIHPHGPIWDHILGYWNLSLKEPEKVLFMKYEDLKEDTVSEVKRIADFLGLPFSSKEVNEGVAEEITKLCSFECLSNLEINKSLEANQTGMTSYVPNKVFFRKGEIGDWKNYMTPSMGEHLDMVIQQKLSGSGLKF